jgi:hypothetical protein
MLRWGASRHINLSGVKKKRGMEEGQHLDVVGVLLEEFKIARNKEFFPIEGFKST